MSSGRTRSWVAGPVFIQMIQPWGWNPRVAYGQWVTSVVRSDVVRHTKGIVSRQVSNSVNSGNPVPWWEDNMKRILILYLPGWGTVRYRINSIRVSVRLNGRYIPFMKLFLYGFQPVNKKFFTTYSRKTPPKKMNNPITVEDMVFYEFLCSWKSSTLWKCAWLVTINP